MLSLHDYKRWLANLKNGDVVCLQTPRQWGTGNFLGKYQYAYAQIYDAVKGIYFTPGAINPLIAYDTRTGRELSVEGDLSSVVEGCFLVPPLPGIEPNSSDAIWDECIYPLGAEGWAEEDKRVDEPIRSVGVKDNERRY